MPRFPYTFFSQFAVRVPTLPYKDFKEIFSKDTDDKKLELILRNRLFKESIYLASVDLYNQLEDYIKDKNQLGKALKNKLRIALIKYFNRMSTRCTPFGLFSGVGLGCFDQQYSFPDTSINLMKLRETNLDMHFLVFLSEQLLTISDIRYQILFYPNNSIYKVGKRIRYIEHENKDMKRDYFISTAPLSQELEKILENSKKGMTISQLADVITTTNITQEEAINYVNELIENRVLVSEMEPNVAGDDFLDSIILILDRIGEDDKKEILLSIKSKLALLDHNIDNSVIDYKEIEYLVKSLNIDYQQKYLFQTDLYFDNKFTLPIQLKKDVKQGISVLNKITLANLQNTALEKFKNAFYERFQNEEIPLAFALDTEIGICYREDIKLKGIHHYIEDLNLQSSSEKNGIQVKLNPIQILLNHKMQKVLQSTECIIKLTDEDLADFSERWDDLPDTLYFMTESISEGTENKVYINYGGGNAGRLLGRFCSEKSEVKSLFREILQKEDDLRPEKISAEIIHLPEARIGNILRRSNTKEYEIPYLAKSLLPDDKQIFIDDLTLSISNDRLILRSKLHNKEVIPSINNAHNYSSNSLPLYQFLCDFSSQNIRSGLYFDWGGLAKIYRFLPRVEYKNIILSKARWKIFPEEIKKFLSHLQNSDKYFILKEIEYWRNLNKIPQWVQWVQDDNTLAINLQNLDLVNLFFLSIKNEKEVIVEEFLCNEEQNFTSQFIFPLFKN
ncbi:lantibiotic dehydratase family protein [Chryseobacterium sp. C-71]|uniref:lantibiotic dehydratase family protein n=1 Tax=Chryseobacterium sp. C-71 TaxID=2893882 RepID=UPI001E52B287|nr:lantibiotic dehydratase family protein [Chryseobacterium sp. C-71]UFH32319.1 lantibiotic dehydratase family protein [Chryseobacterium sp. C-71]